MQIQSTAVRPQTQSRRKLVKEFKQAKDVFLEKSEDHFERSESYNRWGTRIGLGLGAGVLAGGAALMMRYAPGVEGYGMAFPPILAAAGTIGIAHYVTQKLLSSKIEKANFQESRETLVEKRDQYREALLNEVNDSDVRAITDTRWKKLTGYEDQSSVFPTRVEMRLLEEVKELEFLTDQRQTGGWIGALANAQDDPKIFGHEANTVVVNGGIHQVMVDALGVGEKDRR